MLGFGFKFPNMHKWGSGAIPGVLSAGSGSYIFSGQDVSLLAHREIAAAGGSYAFNGQTAAFIRSYILEAGEGSYNFAGQNAILTVFIVGGTEINAESGSYLFAGDSMTPIVDYILPADGGAYAFAGQTASLLRSRELEAAGGSYAFAGQDATLTKSSNYTGPGDIVSGSIGWWSVARAYSAAFAAGGTAVMKLVDQAGANAITINVLSTGFVDIAAITAWVAANSVTTIRVNELYDQSGAGKHATNATLSQMPQLSLSALNGLPVMTFTSARGDRLNTAASFTQAQPISLMGVAKRTASFTTEQGILGATPTQLDIMFGTATDVASTRAGSTISRAASNSNWHTIMGILNGASPNSIVVVDGTATTGSGGSNSLSAVGLRIGRSSGGATLDGQIAETGIWPSAFNGTQYGDLSTNARSAGMYNF
jgi:hypothetical protein